MCSGLFSSSANGARASRATAYFGLSTSTRTDRSDWTMNGLVGSNVGAGGGAIVFGSMGTVGLRGRSEHRMVSERVKGEQAHKPTRCHGWALGGMWLVW